MKIVLGAALLAATCLFYTNAAAQSKEKPEAAVADAWGWGHKVKPTEIDFTIEILYQGTDNFAGMNRHGEMALGHWDVGTSRSRGVFVNRQNNRVMFDCVQFGRPDEAHTSPVAINNDGTILGGCGSGTDGFIRKKGGLLNQFSVPGADGMMPYGFNDREDVVGEYYTPFPAPNVSGYYRFHSFLCTACASPEQKLSVISAPPYPDDLGAPDSLTYTQAIGINRHMQIIGIRGTIFTPSNRRGMWSAFVYDNGQFTDLPADLIPQAINNDGTILAQRTNGQFVLVDDGKVFTTAIPDPYQWVWVDGLTDKGELYGWVRLDSGNNVQVFKVLATPK